MLNYVWLALIVLGIGVAISTDLVEKNNNKYQNNTPIPVQVRFDEPFKNNLSKTYNVRLSVSQSDFSKYYKENVTGGVVQNAKVTYDKDKKNVTLFLKTGDTTPKIWKQMAKVTGKEDDLNGKVYFYNFQGDSAAKAGVVFEEVSFAKMKDVTSSALSYAGTAVNIALELIGIMALWLGIMKIAEEAGLITIIAKALKPVTKFLFPDVPSDHPAMGSMIMNISANMLGLSNAATPFGLKAMEELDKLNPNKGTATNAMCTFLAVNTAGLTFIPATAIAIRAASGSSDPAIIIGTSVFGAICATIVGVTSAKIMEKFPVRKGESGEWFRSNVKGLGIFMGLIVLIALVFALGIAPAIGSLFSFISPSLFKDIVQIISILAIPGLIFIFIVYGFFKKVKIYEKFIEGAKEGFNVAVRIIPFLVGMLVAIGIFRAGGAMDFLIYIIRPVTDLIGMPAEALPMALMRPLSGSGSLGIMAETISVHGPDSMIGILVSTFYGSSETTFYVLAVYFGSVGIARTRHALAAGLLADLAGALGALFIVKLLFG
ncbi:MAG TPA: nucleoside recognition domain-containing protein [Ignavibacteriales bacterium]|nr:nucleoside recognition domain-containing protein [Ignavibacteriales bacterium]